MNARSRQDLTAWQTAISRMHCNRALWRGGHVCPKSQTGLHLAASKRVLKRSRRQPLCFPRHMRIMGACPQTLIV
jgi:hypothetical protein